MSEWLTLSQTGGTGDTQITITAATSEELYNRIAKFRASTPNHLTADFMVNQYGTESFYFRCYYYVEDLNANNAPIFYGTPTGLYQMSVDGGGYVNANSAYTFSEAGLHVIDYTLSGTTEIPSGMLNYTNNIHQVQILYSVDIGDLITGVGSSAFNHQGLLTGVTFGQNVEVVYSQAFAYCDLRELQLPLATERIFDGAFMKNTNMTYVSLPNNLRILGGDTFNSLHDVGVFQGCESLTDITIPSGIDYFHNDIFKECFSLSSITCGDIIYIGDAAFGDTSVSTIPSINTVRYIGANAFQRTKIANLTIPSTVLCIYAFAFEGCNLLTSVSFDSSSPIIELYERTFGSCSSLSSVTLPQNLIYIGSYCFADTPYLWSISIPSSVVDIDNGAFQYSGILNLTMPPKCTRVAPYTFNGPSSTAGNTGLTKITLHDKIYRVEGAVIGQNVQNTTYTIPQNVEYIVTDGSETVFGYHQVTELYFYPVTPPENFRVGDVTVRQGGYVDGNNTFIKICPTGATIHYVSGAYNDLNIATLEATGLYFCVGDLSISGATQPTTSLTATYEIAQTGANTILNNLDYRVRKIKLAGGNSWIDPVTSYNFSTTGTYMFDIFVEGGVVPDNIFSGNTKLKEVEVTSNEIRIVGNYVNSGLRQITLPSVLCRTSNLISLRCVDLVDIINSDKLFVCPDMQGNSSLTGFTFGSYCIGAPNFQDCSSLVSISLPSSLRTFVLRQTFWGCSALTSATIVNTYTKFMVYTYRRTPVLTSAAIPSPVVSITQLFNDLGTTAGTTNVYAYPEVVPYGDLQAAAAAKRPGTLHYPSGSDYSRWLTAYDFTYYGWTGVADL